MHFFLKHNMWAWMDTKRQEVFIHLGCNFRIMPRKYKFIVTSADYGCVCAESLIHTKL